MGDRWYRGFLIEFKSTRREYYIEAFHAYYPTIVHAERAVDAFYSKAR